ncbi:MAG: nucleotidyltransferase family protein [Solirubrobacteraceae bacterium]
MNPASITTTTKPPPTAPPDAFWGAALEQRDAWPTPAQELLLQATLLRDERALCAWRQVRPRLDIATLDGPTQALLPMLRKNLIALGVEDELLALFKGVHRYSWARTQTLLAPMVPRVQALEHAGIQTLLLKGAAFVADTRLDAGMRSMNDIDVLVPSERVGDAVAVLLQEGLTPVGAVQPWYVVEYAPRFVPSHGFRDEHDRQLDLHWNVLHASRQLGADADFWAAAVPIELLGVPTRALCPADELLLVISHGLRWNALPTYRWVLDAALVIAGTFGEVDYDRLVEQARRRRVTVLLRAGLAYLRRVAAIQIPDATMRALGPLRPRPLERIEHRAQMTQPRRRTTLQREVLAHQYALRHLLPLGARPTPREHLRLARERLGLVRLRDLPKLRHGYIPGPDRPFAETAAPVGAGIGVTSSAPIALGEPLELGGTDFVRERAAYGMWRPEALGCWIAGREARLVLALGGAPETSLLLEVHAEGLLSDARPRQRMSVSVNGRPVAEFAIEENRDRHSETMALPREALVGRSMLDLRFEAPDAASPAQLGFADDDRCMGVYLRRLIVREPRAYALGEHLAFGEGSGDEYMLAGGWNEAEPEGRWTSGPLAQLLLGVAPSTTASSGSDPHMLEFLALPLLGAPARELRVDLLANGHALATLLYGETNPGRTPVRVPIPMSVLGATGELLLAWRIHAPRSPQELGISSDERPLGLYFQSLALIH